MKWEALIYLEQHLSNVSPAIVTGNIERRVFGDRMNPAVSTMVQQESNHLPLTLLTCPVKAMLLYTQ